PTTTGDGASDPPAWEHALRTPPWGQYPVTEEFIAAQQHAADLFHANGLIERDIRVSDAVLPAVNALVTASRPADQEIRRRPKPADTGRRGHDGSLGTPGC